MCYNGDMKRNDQTFKEMVARIQSGELTRAQAAEAYGINPGTLGVWLQRSKLADSTKMKDKPPAGAALGWKHLDPERKARLEEAARRVLSREINTPQARDEYPGIGLTTITKRVRALKEDAGMLVHRRVRT